MKAIFYFLIPLILALLTLVYAAPAPTFLPTASSSSLKPPAKRQRAEEVLEVDPGTEILESWSRLPEGVQDIVIEQLSHQSRARLRMTDKTHRNRVKDDIMSLYYRENPQLGRVGEYLQSRNLPVTSALSLYKFCMRKNDTLVPVHFSSLWNCFQAVDQLELYPIANVRVQMVYAAIEEAKNGYFSRSPAYRDILPELLDRTEWTPTHRSALLHYAAKSFYLEGGLNFRARLISLFLNLHQRFCGIGPHVSLTGACLASLVTLFPSYIPDDVEMQPSSLSQFPLLNEIRQTHFEPWIAIEEEQNAISELADRMSDSEETYQTFLEALAAYLLSGGSVHLKWFGNHWQNFKFGPDTRFGAAVLEKLFNAGLSSSEIGRLLPMLIFPPNPELNLLNDVAVAKMILLTGTDFENDLRHYFQVRRTGQTYPGMFERFKTIPIEILALIGSFTHAEISIGYVSPDAVDRAKELVKAGVSFIESESLVFPISMDVATFLLDKGADIYEEDPIDRKTVFQQRLTCHLDQVTKDLIQSGRVRINHQNSYGRTPLHTLTIRLMFEDDAQLKSDILDMITLLLANGADPSIADSEGKMANQYLIDELQAGTFDPRYSEEYQGLLMRGIFLLSGANGSR